jgi:Na+-translocating ferredoxin:NAD+ oxidoreductase subunit C
LLGRTSFHGGIHPPPEKQRTAHLPIEPFPSPHKVVIHLAQYAGRRTNVIVKQGDHVRIGQTIGEPAAEAAVSVHASISGKVLRIDQFAYADGRRGPAIEIENDNTSEMIETPAMEKSWREAAPGELVRIIAAAGIVGMGRAAFPTHIKLSPPSNLQIHTFVVNGIEDEPYLTADYRLLLEKTEEILTGALIVNKILGVKRTVIALDSSKQEAVAKLSRALKDPKFKDIGIAKLKPKYPQGSEHMLTQTLIKKQIPSGGSPADIGCVVLNVATVNAIYNAICSGMPLVQRVITVSGPAAHSPKNLLVPIGTPMRLLLEFCGVTVGAAHKIVMGGPMTGTAQADMDVSVEKSTCGIVAFDKVAADASRHDCINCGTCVKTCPMLLVPSLLAKYVNKNNIEEAVLWGLIDCIECGSCAYACPSKIDLIHYIKLGKYLTSKQNVNVQAPLGI